MQTRRLMETNLYSFRGTVLIAGSCLEDREPEIYRRFASEADTICHFCLEETHLNMALTKIAAMLGTGQITKVVFITVDRSPHCVQMHFICHEIERTMPNHVPMESWVVSDGTAVQVRPETIERAKSLALLEQETSGTDREV